MARHPQKHAHKSLTINEILDQIGSKSCKCTERRVWSRYLNHFWHKEERTATDGLQEKDDYNEMQKGPRKPCMKLGADEELETTVFLWFRQKRVVSDCYSSYILNQSNFKVRWDRPVLQTLATKTLASTLIFNNLKFSLIQKTPGTGQFVLVSVHCIEKILIAITWGAYFSLPQSFDQAMQAMP